MNKTLKILTTVILYGISVYLAFICPTIHPYMITFVFTLAHGLLSYGLWVEGWLDKKK